MIVGGMFDVDHKLMGKETAVKDFSLRFDTAHQYERKVYTNNGRTATTYAVLYGMKLKKGDRVLVPEYNCISVFNALEAVDLDFDVYKVKEGLVIDTDDLEKKITPDTRCIYVIHYFGVPQPAAVAAKLKELAQKYHLFILEDMTQTVLSRGDGRMGFGDYVVMSTRKWYCMTDGGLVAARNDMPFEIVDLPEGYDQAVYLQMAVSLSRRYLKEGKEVFSYLQLEKEANKARYLDMMPKKMTEMSQNIFFQSDHEESVRKRRENYMYLYDHLKDINGISVFGKELDKEENEVPFGFQVMVEDRSDFYDYLAKHGVIGEIQWLLPVQYYTPSDYAAYLGDHSLMLQCDQRYGEADMEYTVKIIKQYLEEKRETGQNQ